MTEYQKHTTHTDALDTLGTIIGEGEKRDAIHIAVFPAVAAERLNPGDHVYLVGENIAAQCHPGHPEAVGIVDPFLTSPVPFREGFWLLVYPRQITSLRHVWEHPDFPASREVPVDLVKVQAMASQLLSDKATSEQWLRDFCNNSDVPGFHATIGAALEQQDDDYVVFYGSDAHGDIPDEFWHHLGIYTGETIVSNPAKHFTCSC